MFNRFNQAHTEVSVTTAVATTEEILFGSYSMGMLQVASGSAATTLTFHTAEKKGGTYLPAYDYDGNAVVLTVAAGRSYPIPLALSGAVAFKMVGNDTATLTIPMKA